MSTTEIDIRSEWTCPDCGARAFMLHVTDMEIAWQSHPALRVPPEPVVQWEIECTRGHKHPCPKGAAWRMTPEESAAMGAAEREAREVAERAATAFKARIVGRTITDYEEVPGSDGDEAVRLTLDDGSVLRVEANGYEESWVRVELEER